MPLANGLRKNKRQLSKSDSSDDEMKLSGSDYEDDKWNGHDVNSDSMLSDDGEDDDSKLGNDDKGSEDNDSDVDSQSGSPDDDEDEEEDDDDDDDDDDNDDNDDDGDDDDGTDASSDEKDDGEESGWKPASEEFDKAKAVTSQLRFWEHLLKMRVNLQKAMVIINQLPQCERLHELVAESGEPCQQAIANGRNGLKRLLDQLFELESLLLVANPETKSLLNDGDDQQHGDNEKTFADEDDEEITSESEPGSDKEDLDVSSLPKKRTARASEYPQLITKRHKAFEKFRNTTIQKWADKTQSLSKFSAFDQSFTKQLQQTLSDKSKLIARTRVNRLGNRVLGKVVDVADAQASASGDQDEEIFDDNDFYHHILREFIQYKNSYDPIVLTKQWLEIQQYRKKAKKHVDRKASKGRKTRYNVHKPLINFMAPVYSPDLWTNEQRDDLFKNLFGKAHDSSIS